jgi:hypothetical protein
MDTLRFNLGDIGAKASVVVRRLTLVFVFGGPLSAADGRIEGGGRVLRTHVFAHNGDAGLVIDEDMVMRLSAIGRRADDLDAVAL